MSTPVRAAFEHTALPYREQLFGSAMKLTRNEGDAEDLVQEVMLRAFAAFHRFKEGTNCRAWLFRIMFNTFINGYRRRKKELELFNADDISRVQRNFLGLSGHETERQDPELNLINRQIDIEVSMALAELPEVYRSVVVLSGLHGFSYKDIAYILDCPVGTVMSRLFRGRRLMREQLASYATSEGIIRATQPIQRAA